MTTRPKKSAKKSPAVAGWRELVHLPDLGIGPIIAKLDTGARTAALHAENLEIYQSGEGERIRFDAFVDDAVSHAKQCDLPLIGTRKVKNTGGGVEERALVKTRLSLGGRVWTVEITLTDRAEMGVPMLLGRATIKRRLVVHPGKSFVLSADGRAAQRNTRRKP
ncbi:MAG: ATP-dependent zinc protease [Rhizobiales bacterium]|nr:ATP-dependent zinc protease [Hyphomicrobiales bacterium]